MIIKNRSRLETGRLRSQALEIIEAGIRRVLPASIMKQALKYDAGNSWLTVEGDRYAIKGRLFVIGGGKASGLMAETLEQVLPPKQITAGVVNCKGGAYQVEKIRINLAGHPIPDQRGMDGVKEMLALKPGYSIDQNDIVLCLISGGGSALMPFPLDSLTLEDIQQVTGLLLGCGADIVEINTIRKHLSRLKGGKLGQYLAPATVISLILSDVIGNDLATIASGPTYPDLTTFTDAWQILKKYGLEKKIPAGVKGLLEKGLQGMVSETPKALANCHNYVIGDNRLALEAMAAKAREFGFKPCIITAEQKGETTEAASFRASEILKGQFAGCNAVLIGGETTPRLPDPAGKGGRNQHYAVVSMLRMANYPGNWVVASIGTDGSDYLPDIAGAIVDKESLTTLQSQGIDARVYIASYDSNTLLNHAGNSLIITGETGTNVGDLILYLLE